MGRLREAYVSEAFAPIIKDHGFVETVSKGSPRTACEAGMGKGALKYE